MDKIVQTFEGLIRRGLAPSVTFFVFVVLGDLIRAHLTGTSVRAQALEYLRFTGKGAFGSPAVFLTLALVVTLGFSYALTSIQQLLFDNWLKRNFDPSTRFSRSAMSEARALTELRRKVTQRLRNEPALGDLRELQEVTDYLLYEILGGIDPLDTRGFVDSAKATGVVFVSAIVVLLGNALVFHARLGPWVVLLVLLAVLLYWWGREATVTQYRMRALRLYVNFLAMPTARIQRRLLRPEEDPTLVPPVKK